MAFLFRRKRSASSAKERMQLVLIHDRTDLTPSQLEALKDDLARHQTRQAHIPGNCGTDHGYSKHQGDNDRPQQPKIEMPPEVATEHKWGGFYYASSVLTGPSADGIL